MKAFYRLVVMVAAAGSSASAIAAFIPDETQKQQCAQLALSAAPLEGTEPLREVFRRSPVVWDHFLSQTVSMTAGALDHVLLQAYSDPFYGHRGEAPPQLLGSHPSHAFLQQSPLLYQHRLAFWRWQNATAQEIINTYHSYSHYYRDPRPEPYQPPGLFLVFFPETGAITGGIVHLRREPALAELRHFPLIALVNPIHPLPRETGKEQDKFFNQADRILFLRAEDAGKRMSEYTSEHWSHLPGVLAQLASEPTPVRPTAEEAEILIADAMDQIPIPVVPGRVFQIHLAGCYDGSLIRKPLAHLLHNVRSANPQLTEIQLRLRGEWNLLRQPGRILYLRDVVSPEGVALTPAAMREFYQSYLAGELLPSEWLAESDRNSEDSGPGWIARPPSGPTLRIIAE